jgi:alpha-L-rhamnosidase
MSRLMRIASVTVLAMALLAPTPVAAAPSPSTLTVGGLQAAPSALPTWPANPNWQQYVQSPSSPDVLPVSIVSTSGNVTNAAALTNPSAGNVATLTATPPTLSSSPVTLTFPTVQARYIRLNVTKLGLPAADNPTHTYLQLAEMQVFGADPSQNLALGESVTASETIEASGWGKQYLTDGVTDTQNPVAHGYTSLSHSSTDVSGSPVWVVVDLGSVQSVSSVVLWPRTDLLSSDRQTASFPVDYSIQTSATDSQSASFAVQETVTGQTDPPVPVVNSGGATIILDYGHEVGGFPTFDVSAESGSPTLEAGYSETRTWISPTGDGNPPWGTGDHNRYDTYQVSQPGRITNAMIQGGERYEEISLTTPGTVSLSAVGILYTPPLAKPDSYSGYFVSSSDQLNRLWYDGVYTAEMDQLPVGTSGPRWNTDQGSLDVPGTTAGTGLLTAGKLWTDYTLTFTTMITANEAGWMVRGQDAQDGYLLILDASTDTLGGANVLQELSQVGSTNKRIANVRLSQPILTGTWHTIKEVVSGTTVTTYIDGSQVASFDSATFAPGVAAYSAGSVGFREFSGEEASFKDLSVTAPGGTLYQNALSDSAAISDFTVPGPNTIPLILDGAKRDRAVWSGDLSVEGPTLFYSTNTSDYIRSSLELLGSWAGSNGYVSGDISPETAVNTGPPPATVHGGYSATYSMYFVRDLAVYYQYTADTGFVQKEWPVVANELAWSASQVDSNGLFATTSSDGKDWDYYDGAKTGEVTEYNALYYQTLIDGALLATAAGHPDLASKYSAQASALKTAINATLFNTSTGVYDVSNTVKGVIAQDANVFAIDFGLAPADKVSSILATIKSSLWTPFGTLPYSSGYKNFISPFVSGYELTARFGAGDTTGALQLLSNEWGPMIAPGDLYTGTFWENESTTGTQAWKATSMAHGWSTMPTSALSEYVLGIQPVDPGYQTWLVQPHPGDLAWTEGQAPTANGGSLSVKWAQDTTAGVFHMQVVSPSGTGGEVWVPLASAAKGVSSALTPGATLLRRSGNYDVYSVGVGTFEFSSVIDNTAPVTTATASPASPDGQNRWYTSGSVGVSLSATDDLSGVASTSYTVDGGATQTYSGPFSVSGDGVHAVAFWSTDVAGNIETAKSLTLSIDATKPVVTYSGNAGSYTVDQTVAITCSATDPTPGSGLASTTCDNVNGPAYSFGLDSHTYSASATDIAGNVGSASTTFTVKVTFTSLENLVTTFSSDPSVTSGLNDKLIAASTAKNANTRDNQLNAFINQVNAQTGKALTAAQVQVLITLANALK